MLMTQQKVTESHSTVKCHCRYPEKDPEHQKYSSDRKPVICYSEYFSSSSSLSSTFAEFSMPKPQRIFPKESITLQRQWDEVNVGERRGEIEVKNTSFKWVILTLTVSSAVSWQTINARFSHYHSFGRRYLIQYKTQIGFQISKITNELYDKNDSKPVLAPGFSMPPGIPDCTDPSLCWSPPPGALQNASSAVLQGFLSSPLGGRTLLFPRSPTLLRNSLAERVLGSTRPLFATQHCKNCTPL